MAPGTIVIGRLRDSRIDRPRKVSGLGGLGDLGIGTFANIQAIMREMDTLAPTSDNAQMLVRRGIEAVDRADSIAVYAAASPGNKAQRADIRAHLSYYDANPGELESGFWDIKSWNVRAFIAYNAALQAARTGDLAESQFLSDTLSEYKQAIKKVGTVASDVVAATAKTTAELAGGFLSGLLSNPTTLLTFAVLGVGAYYAWPYVKKVVL